MSTDERLRLGWIDQVREIDINSINGTTTETLTDVYSSNTVLRITDGSPGDGDVFVEARTWDNYWDAPPDYYKNTTGITSGDGDGADYYVPQEGLYVSKYFHKSSGLAPGDRFDSMDNSGRDSRLMTVPCCRPDGFKVGFTPEDNDAYTPFSTYEFGFPSNSSLDDHLAITDITRSGDTFTFKLWSDYPTDDTHGAKTLATNYSFGTQTVANNSSKTWNLDGNFDWEGNAGVNGGVTFNMGPGSGISVYGALAANGGPQTPVIFQRSGSSSWNEILAYGNGAEVDLDHVNISGADYGLYLYYAGDVSIKHTTISNSTYYGLYAFGTSNWISYSTFEQSGDDGLFFNGSSGYLVESDFTNNTRDGLHFQLSDDVFFGCCGDYGYNTSTGNGRHGVYASGSSIEMGQKGTIVLPEPQYSHNSIHGNGNKDVYARNESDITAEKNWWGEDPPNTSDFYTSSNSTLDYDPWLSSDPNGGSSPSVQQTSPTAMQASRSGASSTPAAPDGSPAESTGEVRLSADTLRTGEFVGRVHRLRRKQGHGQAAQALASVASRKGHPQQHLAQALRLTDLLYRGKTEAVVKQGERLFDKSVLSTGAKRLAAETLFGVYLEETGNPKAARQMRDFLVRTASDEGRRITRHRLNSLLQKKGALLDRGSSSGQVRSAHVEEQATTPEQLALRAAYPNPVRDHATLPLALPEHAEVRAAVYDVMGRRVRVLADGRYAAGTHRLALEAGDLPAGVYVLRARVKTPAAGANTFTRKVTVAR